MADSLREDDLERLARQARAGCSTSFEELARRVSPNLLNFLRQRAATIQDAEDLRQETLLRVYQNLESYDPSRPFGPWMMTIAARLAAGRARGRRTTEPLFEDVAGGREAVDEGAQRREAGQTLWAAAVRLLPAAQYRVLRLRYVDQLDVREVAAAAGVTVANAKVLLLRARRKLMESPQVRGLLASGRESSQEEWGSGLTARSPTPSHPSLVRGGKDGWESGQETIQGGRDARPPAEDDHAL